jgi:hypothetical protein
MSDARERLTRLIELARENVPEKQPALAFELCDLLVDWPERYPKIMREPFEALLEKVLRRLDGTTRNLIATRLAGRSETAVTLLNEFYLDASTEARERILARNAESRDDELFASDAHEEEILIAAARDGRDLVGNLARALKVPASAAQAVLADPDALAVACKGAKMRRATYSALTLLLAGDGKAQMLYERLTAFDAIPEKGAQSMLAHWRGEPNTRAA